MKYVVIFVGAFVVAAIALVILCAIGHAMWVMFKEQDTRAIPLYVGGFLCFVMAWAAVDTYGVQ